MKEIQRLIKGLSEDDFGTLRYWVAVTETDRRNALPAVQKAEAELVRDLQDAGQLPKPAAAEEGHAEHVPAWQSPGTGHAQMYHTGQVVTHNGRTWVSRHEGLNHWEPGATGVDERIWEDITPAPEPTPDSDASSGPPAWQPGQNYAIGTLVTFSGQTYRVTQDHTSADHWQPPSAPSLYQIHHL